MGWRGELIFLLLFGAVFLIFNPINLVNGSNPGKGPINGPSGTCNYKQPDDYCGKDDNNDDVDPECCKGTYRPTAWCDELTRFDDLAWTRPFTGFDENGVPLPRDTWAKVCDTGYEGAPVGQGFYRMVTDENGFLNSKIGYDPKMHTNRLRFFDEHEHVIAQEGLSFCVIGTHYRKAPWSLWEPLKGFRALAEKSFDIGNHIHPNDSRKMNRVKLPNEDKLRDVWELKGGLIHHGPGPNNPWHKQTPHNSTTSTPMLPTHRFEYVWMGVQGGTTSTAERHKGLVHVDVDKGFYNRPAHPEWQPDESCMNPYRVTTTLIEADQGITLHNYLHITVKAEPVSRVGKNCPTGRIKYLLLEVRDQDGYPVGQFTDDVTCDQNEASRDSTLVCPMPPCKAHYGTKQNHVPCMFSHPKASVHPSIFMFTAATGSGAGTGSGATGANTDDFCRNSQIPKSSRKPPDVKPKDNNDQYVTEVHATWRYAQMDHAWVSELHFATLIVEDETPIQYYTSRQSAWVGVASSKWCFKTRSWVLVGSPPYQQWYCTDCPDSNVGCTCCHITEGYNFPTYRAGRIILGLLNSCVNETYNTNRPYGYSARYQAIKPTFNTRGGWDYFRQEHIDPGFVNCHVDITFGKDRYYEYIDEKDPEQLGRLPLRTTLKDFLVDKYTLLYKNQLSTKYQEPPFPWKRRTRDGSSSWQPYPNTYELPDWHNPGMSKSTDGTERITAYFGKQPIHAILKMFDSAHQDPIVLKTEFDDQPYREYFGSRYCVPKDDSKAADALKAEHGDDQKMTMEEMSKEKRCPCPFVPTTLPPELATKNPMEIEGRRTHVVNMLLAWVVLVPVAYFVARFYKETYSRVFFLQEFWWFTLHLLCLVTALIFSIGGIYVLYVKRSYGEPYEIVWTDATRVHVYMGYGTLGIFAFHLLVGGFRFEDVELRIIQIGLHWLFGWLEYLFVVTVIMSAGAIPSGIMNCVTFGIYCGFLGFQLAFQIGMEIHIHRVDEELHLDPPRAYMPPPMMRVFHRDAPHSRFRMAMLAVFTTGCFLFYVALHLSMNWEGAEFSCFQPEAEQFAEEITT